MSEFNYEQFLCELVKPLVAHPDEVVAKVLSEEDDLITVQVLVNQEDIGRIIGKKGRVINAIRTIAFATSSKYGKKVDISVDSF